MPETNWCELQQALRLAEEEDRNEEETTTDHIVWCIPQIRKRKKNKDGNEEYHDIGTDFSFVGLRGQDHVAMGWMNWGAPNATEKQCFTRKQRILVNHYTWFYNTHPERIWLRS